VLHSAIEASEEEKRSRELVQFLYAPGHCTVDVNIGTESRLGHHTRRPPVAGPDCQGNRRATLQIR